MENQKTNMAHIEKMVLARKTAKPTVFPARKNDIEAVLRHTPASWKDRYRKVLSGGKSRRLAMNVKCAECVGFEDVVTRVGERKTERCPLWAFRPFQDRP